MQVRLVHVFGLVVAGGLGFALPTSVFSGEVGRLLVTFIGLLAAGILPTISLIVGSVSAQGRSVRKLRELKNELSHAMSYLFQLFALLSTTVVAILLTALPRFTSPVSVYGLIIPLEKVWSTMNAVVLLLTFMCVVRAIEIPKILQRCLDLRHEIAEDEAKRKTNEKAPSSADIAAAFPRHPDFGKTIKLADLEKSRGQ